MSTDPITFYCLHNGYPGGGWRGIESCLSNGQCAMLLFSSEADAIEYLQWNGLDPDYWRVWPIVVNVPWVGERVD